MRSLHLVLLSFTNDKRCRTSGPKHPPPRTGRRQAMRSICMHGGLFNQPQIFTD